MNYYSIVRTAKHKYGEMTFLTSISVSKRVLFALGVDPTARDAGEGRGSDKSRKLRPSHETSSRSCYLTTQV